MLYNKSVFNTLCDLICDVITRSVWSWDTGKSNVSDKIWVENQKKREKYGNKRYFYINLHLIDRIDIEFIAC